MPRLSDGLIADINPQSDVSESFRSLRTYIRQHRLLEDGESKVLLFASGEEGEGKTTVIANLAVSFVQDGKKVAVVDCNLRDPGLHSIFGVEGSYGLAAYLDGSEEMDRVYTYGTLANLTVIPAGISKASPADLLGNDRWPALLQELRETHDLILLDTPPAVSYSDARVIAPFSDGVILVARYGRSKRDTLRRVKELMEQAGANMMGIAMNRIRA